MPDACVTCRFWRAVPDGEPAGDVSDYGQCRRFPPTVSDHMASIAIQRPGFGGNEPDPEDIATPSAVQRSCLWPVLFFNEWCGEHRPSSDQQVSQC